MKGRKLKDFILNEINNKGLPLSKRMPNGFTKEMMGKTGRSKNIVESAVHDIRKELGIKLENNEGETNKKKKKKRQTRIYKYITDAGFNRRSPTKEISVCNEIVDCLFKRILKESNRKGNVGVLIGTQTPIAVCPNNKTYGRRQFPDNLIVAYALYRLCGKMYIKIGNAVDKVKASKKVEWWRELFGLNVSIESVHLDSKMYYKVLDSIASRYRNKNVIVVFMGSGVWKGGSTQYGFQTDFKKSSQLLVNKHNNLTIIAMVAKTNMRFSVKILGDRR